MPGLSLFITVLAGLFTLVVFGVPALIFILLHGRTRARVWNWLKQLQYSLVFVVFTSLLMSTVALINIEVMMHAGRMVGPLTWFTPQLAWLALSGYLLWAFGEAAPLDPARLWSLLLVLPICMIVYLTAHIVRNGRLTTISKSTWFLGVLASIYFFIPIPAIIYMNKYGRKNVEVDIRERAAPAALLGDMTTAEDDGESIDLKTRNAEHIERDW